MGAQYTYPKNERVQYSVINALLLRHCQLRRLLGSLLILLTLNSPVIAQDKPVVSPAESLSANACLQQLNDNDEVVVTAAFHEGIGGFGQLEELIARKPWGSIGVAIQTQLDQLIEELSPFLIVKVTKKQALALDSHRDLIKWILVQSTDTVCS